MRKLKRYLVTQSTYQLYEVYSTDKKAALNIVKNGEGGGLAGLLEQQGFNSLIHDRLESFEVKDFPTKTKGDV